ncbi:MAG TPA: selenocysteine-specific translation elongation factor [Xanthobacteraceae bacterium]|nr:selenocysteine-specific translation elongation factor [Xanthobacteraceae bacterium]
MIIGTAGHIDHGKTALIKALTGVDTDRLKEEKARGITIDLGFAYLPTETGTTLGFIDVPGHERLVHTMLAGASGIDFVLLVVAADDGLMPQTREHLAIIDILGITHGIVAVSKADAVPPDRIAAVSEQIRETLEGTTLEGAELVPVSALTGDGIDELRRKLVVAANKFSSRPADGYFRLAVDRSFTLAGVGTVVTGTVLSGSASIEDHVVVSPSGLRARIRSMHVQNKEARSTRAGDRCALNLVGDGITKDGLHRGDVVLNPALHTPTDRIDARLRLLPNGLKGLRQWFPVRLHHASTEVGAHVVLLEDKPLAPGDEADVQFVLERPIAAAAHDRFVIRDVSAQHTLGGGYFIDLRAPERRRRSPEREAQRAASALQDPVRAFAGLLATPPFAWNISVFLRDRARPVSDEQRVIDALELIVLDTAAEKFVIAPEQWQRLVTDIVGHLTAFHAENPDLQGIGREKLRLLSQPRLAPLSFAAALQRTATASHVVLDGAFIRLPSHTVQMSPKDEETWTTIEPLLGGDDRFRPPRVRDIATATGHVERDIRKILKLAGRMGRADEIAHDHFFLRATVNEMVGIVAQLSSSAGSFTAAQFRDQVTNGRKVAIQILDFFDRHGVTLNRDDLRRVNPHRLDLFGPLMQSSDLVGRKSQNGRESSPVGRPDFKSG